MARQTIADWLISNADSGKANTDRRVKVSKEQKAAPLKSSNLDLQTGSGAW